MRARSSGRARLRSDCSELPRCGGSVKREAPSKEIPYTAGGAPWILDAPEAESTTCVACLAREAAVVEARQQLAGAPLNLARRARFARSMKLKVEPRLQ